MSPRTAAGDAPDLAVFDAGQQRLCLVVTALTMSEDRAEHLRAIVDGAVRAGFGITIARADAAPGPACAALDSLVARHGLDVQFCEPGTAPIEPAYLRPTIGLFRLLRAQDFAAILFQDHEGLGYASIVAKQTGLAFAETVLAVVAFGGARWQRERGRRFPASPVPIAIEYIEQRAIELGDVTILPSGDVALWMRQAGWQLKTTLALPDAASGSPSQSEAWADILRRLRPAEHRPAAPRSYGTEANDTTIVIPSFEQPRLLDQNLHALTQQTDRSFSVLVVDDGSESAEARDYLASIEERYRTLNLRLIRQENRYLGAARNTGIRAAQTDFVILLDDDNVAFPDMVKTLRQAMHLSGADVVTCGMSQFRDAAGKPRPGMDRDGPDLFFSGGPILLGAMHNCFGDATAIYRKRIFDEAGYFHELRDIIFEDWQVHLRVAARGYRLLSLPEPLFWYRVRPNSLLQRTHRYDNARVIAATVREMPCAMLEPLADYLMGSEAEQVRLNGEIHAIQAAAAANSAALLEAQAEASRYAHSLQQALQERTERATNAERYARSLEQTLAELRESHRAATEYAASLEQARAEAEAYARRLEQDYKQ